MDIAEQFSAAVEEEEFDPPTLDLPIDVNFQKRQFSTLHLREPRAKEVERAERELAIASPTPHHFRKYQIALVAAVAQVPVEVVGEVPVSTLRRAWDFLRVKLEDDTPPTGET